MRRIAAGEFKARCLALMEHVCATKEPVLITKRGRPVAKLIPPGTSKDDFVGRLAGVVEVIGDIESPIESPETWKALR